MDSSSTGDDDKPQRLSGRRAGTFLGSGRAGRPAPNGLPAETGTGPDEILSPAQRRAAMSTLNDLEAKWSAIGLAVSVVLGIVLTLYLRAAHSNKTETVTRHGKKVKELVPISDSWLLLGVVVLVFCAVGAVALQRRRRTLVAFSFFVIGCAFTLIFSPLGLAIIVLGGWLMLRAYRIQKFGTANAKAAARQAAARPSRRDRKQAARTPVNPVGRQAPSANKRYTPKSAPRRKVAKPAE